MTDSIRQQIIDKIDARFKSIKATSGYKTNIGAHVFDWLDRDLEGRDLPSLTYKDPQNDKSSATTKIWNNELTIEIDLHSASGATSTYSVREMAEDVYKAIGTDETWSGLAKKTNPVSDITEVEQLDRRVARATIVIRITYETTKWQY